MCKAIPLCRTHLLRGEPLLLRPPCLRHLLPRQVLAALDHRQHHHRMAAAGVRVQVGEGKGPAQRKTGEEQTEEMTPEISESTTSDWWWERV